MSQPTAVCVPGKVERGVLSGGRRRVVYPVRGIGNERTGLNGRVDPEESPIPGALIGATSGGAHRPRGLRKSGKISREICNRGWKVEEPTVWVDPEDSAAGELRAGALYERRLFAKEVDGSSCGDFFHDVRQPQARQVRLESFRRVYACSSRFVCSAQDHRRSSSWRCLARHRHVLPSDKFAPAHNAGQVLFQSRCQLGRPVSA